MAGADFIRIIPLATPIDHDSYSDDYRSNGKLSLSRGMSALFLVVTEPGDFFLWFNGSIASEPLRPLVFFDACSDNNNSEVDCGTAMHPAGIIIRGEFIILEHR
ncbi:hypothetical protein HJFPF1_00086 [Paramyrothecium foliicola]|nr:hypothetical protein HJFPF1_00086 [Paramyrothecium foliicola]